MESIGEYAFVGSTISNLTIPGSVIAIADNAFNIDHDGYCPYITCIEDSVAYKMAYTVGLGIWVYVMEKSK